MPLSSGTRLGPYQIVAPLGAGGMGEVYKAVDTRLERTVAIKILPEHLSAKPQLRERFEREARAVSSLNHPNICTLHDVGHQDGIDFLVMEYLEGETLAHRLKRGPLPLDTALHSGIQVAGALAHAHRHGVVHRDLKPGNIMLTKAGAKVLDFGLAKINASAGVPEVTQPTNTLTEEGVILGTLQYMAPEQLEGREAGARTDIFAFGAVLYEMATGKKAFEGESRASVVAAILKHEPPPVSSLQSLTPPALDHLVKSCLVKDPEQRWQTAHDVMLELECIATGGVPAPKPVGHRSSPIWTWIASAAIASMISGLLVFAFLHKPPDAPVARFTFVPPFKADALDVAVSPDGKRIAFADAAGGSSLWLRSIDSLTVQKLPGTESAIRPFWSSDGRSLGFVSDDGLKRVDLSGAKSSVQTVTSSATISGGALGGSWSPAGIILYQPEQTGTGLYRVAAGGGVQAPATRLNAERKEIVHRYPQFLPDGRHFIYWVWSASEENTGIYAGSLDPKEKLPDGPLVRTWREARYVEPGYLLWLQGSTLIAQRFDTTRLRLTGEPHSLLEPVGMHWVTTGRAMFSASPGGVLAYQEAMPQPRERIVWRDRAGNRFRSVEVPRGSLGNLLSLAPDEKSVAVTGEDENALEDLWVVDLERATSVRLTAIHGSNQSPVWSPDGRRVAFRSNRNGVYDLYVKHANDTSEEELLVKSPHVKYPTSWSPDGRFLLYNELDPKTGVDIWVLPLEGDRKPFVFLKTEFNEALGTLSPLPDSQARLWMAYNSDETGRAEIYLRPFLPGMPGGPAGAKVRVSRGGGFQPQWRRDGRELFYIADNKLMAVDIKLGGTPEIGTPQALFEQSIPEHSFNWHPNWAPSADGRRFLFIEPTGESPAAKINVVLNWMAELKP